MKSHSSRTLIYFFIAIYTNFYLIQGVSAVRAPVGLIFAVGFLDPASVRSAPDQRLKGDRTAVQVRNKEICGGRGPCTNGAACIEQVCKCSPGWIPDPLISPVFDAGWRSCVQQNECLAREMACNDTNAACVDRDPPERFVCVCHSGFTTVPSGSTDPSIECVPSDDSTHPTTTPSSAAPAPEETPAPNKMPSPDDPTCTRECNSPKEFCVKSDGTKGDDWPKCTCNQHFERNANGDSCGMIDYCDSQAAAQKRCPSPGTNCFQHGGEGGYFCLCMDGHTGGPNSEEGCVLTPAPTTSTPSLVPSVSPSPSIAPTTAPPTRAPQRAAPPVFSCAALVCPVKWEFTSTDNLKIAVNDDNLVKSKENHGATNCWDVSRVASMNEVFRKTNFNEDISCWDVSQVVNMDFMFAENSAFDQPLDRWDVSSVNTLHGMFAKTSFNQPLNSWDVSKVTTMSYMFFEADKFNQPLSNWDVSKVTTLSVMFRDAIAFDGSVGDWDVSEVTTMESMFMNAISFNQPLDSWVVSKVTHMNGMFNGATVFNRPLNAWDVSAVTTTRIMFTYGNFNQPLNTWVVSEVVDMLGMFRGNPVFNQPLNDWDIDKVTNMQAMFDGATSFDEPLDEWDVSKVTDMESMFRSSGFNRPLNDWNVISVTTFKYMFASNVVFNQPLSAWEFFAVVDMQEMFMGSIGLNQDLCSWALDSNTVVSNMFQGALSCRSQNEPVLTDDPPGPFCNSC